MKTAVFDIDGVLADYEGQLNRVLFRKFGDRGYCNRDIYSLEKRYAKEPEVLEYALALTADPNFYYPLRPIVQMLSFVEDYWIKTGNEVLFVTTRPESAETFTRRWLNKHLERFVDYTLFCGISRKSEFLLKNDFGEIEFVIEDSPSQIQDLKDNGFNALCYDQRWNQDIFPRLYCRPDGEVMLWNDPASESESFLEFILKERS